MRGVSKAALAIVAIIWLVALVALIPKAPQKFKKAAPRVVFVGTLVLAGLIVFQSRASAISELTEPGQPASLADMVTLFQSDQQASYTLQASKEGADAVSDAVTSHVNAATKGVAEVARTGQATPKAVSIEKTVAAVVAAKRKEVARAYKKWERSPTPASRRAFSAATSAWMSAQASAKLL